MEGAKCGIRLWLVSQRADASILTGPLRSQLCGKISYKIDDDGLRMIFEGITQEQIARAQKFEPGQGYIEITGVQPLIEFRGFLCDYPQLVRTYETPPHR